MSGGVQGASRGSAVNSVPVVAPSAAPVAHAAGAPLPAPTMDGGAATLDVMGMLYALTSKQRDTAMSDQKRQVEMTRDADAAAFEHQQEELEKAKEDQDSGGIFGSIMKAVDTVCDAVVGGNPLQDIAKDIDKALGTKAFEVVYDFIRPDAILHGAAVLAAAATGEGTITQAYDMGAASSSLKTRFQAATDATGEQKIMSIGYDTLRDSIAGAMVTVGTAGVGTATIAAIALSAGLAVESKLDLLGQMGVTGGLATALRTAGQVYAMALTVGSSFATAGIKEGVKTGTKIATNIANGVNETTKGVSTIGQSAYQHSADTHTTNATADGNKEQEGTRSIDRLVSGMRDLTKSYQHTLETLASTVQDRDQLQLSLAHNLA